MSDLGERTETELVALAASGDGSAFKELYERYFSRMYAFVSRVGGGDLDVDDVVQEIFVEMYASLNSLREHKAFVAWFYRLAANVVNRRLYKNDIFRLFDRDTHAVEELPLSSVDLNPEEQLATKKTEEKIRRILAKMKPNQREILVLFELEGFSGEELATMLKIPKKTVWSRLHYAREEFLRLLKQDDFIEKI